MCATLSSACNVPRTCPVLMKKEGGCPTKKPLMKPWMLARGGNDVKSFGSGLDGCGVWGREALPGEGEGRQSEPIRGHTLEKESWFLLVGFGALGFLRAVGPPSSHPHPPPPPHHLVSALSDGIFISEALGKTGGRGWRLGGANHGILEHW